MTWVEVTYYVLANSTLEVHRAGDGNWWVVDMNTNEAAVPNPLPLEEAKRAAESILTARCTQHRGGEEG